MQANDLKERRDYARLGRLNGLFVGLALAAGLWLPSLVTLLRLPVSRLALLVILTAALSVIAVCALAGWLTGRLHHTGASLLIWLAAAVAVIFIAAYRPYQLSTLVAWLVEPTLWGRPIFPPHPATVAGILLSGLFIVLALGVLALLQEYRLQGLRSELKAGKDLVGLTGYGWSRLLLWPLLLALPAAVATGAIFGDRALSRMLHTLDLAIGVAEEYDGDLFERGLQDGVNYAALRGVRNQLGAPYTLHMVAQDSETSQTIVAAHFEDSAWIHCRFINEQLSFCEDASAPYSEGFASFLTGREAACDDCFPAVDSEWAAWLAQRRAAFSGDPQITFVRRRGAHVLVRAAAPDGEMALSCWFEGIDPIRLLQCEESGS